MQPSNAADLKKLMDRAAQALQKGRASDAEADLTAVLKAAPELPGALYGLAMVRMRQNRAKDAVGYLRRAVAAAPEVALYTINLARVLAHGGDAEAGRAVLREARERAPDDPGLLYELGREAILLEDPAGAAEALGRAAELAPKAPQPFGALGVAYQQMGDAESARAAYETAVELGSRDADDYFNLGTVHMNAARYDDAMALFARAGELNPEHQRAFANLGILRARSLDYAGAVAPLERAIALNPDDDRVMNDLVYALAASGRAKDGVAAGERFLKMHPEDAALYPQIAFAQMRAGNAEAAVAACDAALKRLSHPTPALSVKSAALNELGRREEAANLLDFDRFIATRRLTPPPGYPNLPAFNAALVQYLLDEPSLDYIATNRTMVRGRGTQELFDGREHGPAAALRDMIMAAARDYMVDHPADPSHPFLAAPPTKLRVCAWGNVYDREGRQYVHCHPSAWLSGVYYPALPDAMKDGAMKDAASDNNREGWIEFGRALHRLESADEPPVHLVRPEEGLMVLFPSYFGHQTLPVTASEQKRVSIAFDLEPVEEADA